MQRFQGQCDEPFAQLNDLGKEQAKLAGEAIHHEKISFDTAFASDLGRASEVSLANLLFLLAVFGGIHSCYFHPTATSRYRSDLLELVMLQS